MSRNKGWTAGDGKRNWRNIKQGPTHEITCKEKISGEIDKDPRVIQENIKIASENEKMPVGKSSAMEKNTSEEMNERHLREIR